MSKEEIIKDIRDNFEELCSSKNNSNVKALINTISRMSTRLQLKDKSSTARVQKVIVDLKSTEAGEVEFYRLQNPSAGRTEYSKSFYDSITLLKNDLFKMLSEL